ncbi:hypothetical protein CAPTEDRAFT_144012 [Capitella teleta]|uniref:Cytochrome P450 n=1 Tax=Capitella teleta TaxID=283909 RepID=R7THX3_CAPTE|nr:hypothetical protein CAPTEDRAFT_144012 [Capitella teleta]|eukprot:ELT93418.1 hypothetical protein CAPTEDRAFT_144012 [Capitella teleta]
MSSVLVKRIEVLIDQLRDLIEPYAEQAKEIDGKTAAKITVGALVVIPTTYYTYQVVQFFRRLRKIGREVDKLPGDPKHWLWGNLHQHPGLGEEQLDWFVDLTAKYKTVVHFWFGPVRPIVLCLHPSSVKIIAQTAAPKATSGKGGYSLLLPWLDCNAFLVRCSATKCHLHSPIDDQNPSAVGACAKGFVRRRRSKWSTASTKSEDSVEIYQSVSLCTLNVIMRCAFSFDDDVQSQGEYHPYANAVINMANLITKRILLVFDYTIYYATKNGREFRGMCKYAHEVAYDLIKTRRKALEENPNSRKKRYLDFLDILLLARDEAGQGLSELEMRQEVDTFLFEGHDTTASAISWCLYTLAKHPEFQTRAAAEVQSLVAGRDSEHLVWDDLNELPYLTKCIKESLRMTPPVPFIGRELDAKMDIEGVTLLPGTFVDINIWAVHHNEHVWGKDHMQYNPERFNPENMKGMDSFSFIPFSAGPRNCIGQNFAMHELKVIIARILLKFELCVDPDHKVSMKPELVMRAENGIKLFFKPRVL